MAALKAQWLQVQQSRPTSAMASTSGNNFQFFAQQPQQIGHPNDMPYPSNIPMSAPATDMQFFNTMMQNFAAHHAHQQGQSASNHMNMMQLMGSNPSTGMAPMMRLPLGNHPSAPMTTFLGVPGISVTDIPPPPNEPPPDTPLISQNVSLLSALSGDSGVDNVSLLSGASALGMNATKSIPESSMMSTGTFRKKSSDVEDISDVTDSDSNTNTMSRDDTTEQEEEEDFPDIDHKRTLTANKKKKKKTIPSVITHGNKTQDTDDSDSDDSSSSVSTTVTMSRASDAPAQSPNVTNKISKHFKIPSVITDKDLDNLSVEDSADLPSLIEEASNENEDEEMMGNIRDQMGMLPEQTEEEEESDTEMTIELQLDQEDKVELKEATEPEDTDDEPSKETLLTLKTQDTQNLEERTEPESDSDEDEEEEEEQESSHTGFEEYGNDDDEGTYVAKSETDSTSDKNTMSRSYSDDDDDDDSVRYKKKKGKKKGFDSSLVVNDDDIMEDDFDDMFGLTDQDIQRSFNNKEYEDDDDYYDEDDDDGYED